MSLKKDYYGHSKLKGGLAGWKCSCCNPFDCAPRFMKRRARRLLRRKTKQALYVGERE